MTKKKNHHNSNSGRGGYRENAGRKASWNHRDTCTIRIPKTFAMQLVELARRLDNGEKFDIDTESNSPDSDFVTESIPVAPESLSQHTSQQDLPESIDIDTKSNSPASDFVTESIPVAPELLSQHTSQQDLPESIDIDTKSNSGGIDFVTKSSPGPEAPVKEPNLHLDKEKDVDTDTESKLTGNDIVTQSKPAADDQMTSQSLPEFKQAIAQAKTILKAKKSARESLARLLSTLYLTQVRPDDLN